MKISNQRQFVARLKKVFYLNPFIQLSVLQRKKEHILTDPKRPVRLLLTTHFSGLRRGEMADEVGSGRVESDLTLLMDIVNIR